MTLISYYPLNEGSGSTAYDVRGSNDGTNNGATVGVSGINGNTAYSFDPTNNEYLALLDSETAGLSQISVSCWFKPHDLSSQQGIVVGRDNSWSEYWALRFVDTDSSGSADSLEWTVSNGGTRSKAYYSLSNFSTGNWYFLTGTFYGNGNNILYIDGAEADRVSNSITSTASGLNEVRAGMVSGQGQYFYGSIAEVRLYDHALTAAEVQYLYQAGLNADYTSDVRQL